MQANLLKLKIDTSFRANFFALQKPSELKSVSAKKRSIFESIKYSVAFLSTVL